MQNITEKNQLILNAIAKGNHSRGDIAEALAVSASNIYPNVSALKKAGLIEVNDTNGFIDLTEAAMEHVSTRKQRTGTKMEKARQIFDKLAEKGRQAVLSKFIGDLGMTEAGASTYYQTLRTSSGMAFQRKSHKGPKVVKTTKVPSKTVKHNRRSSGA